MTLATSVANKGTLKDFATKSTVTLIKYIVLEDPNVNVVMIGMVVIGANVVLLCKP